MKFKTSLLFIVFICVNIVYAQSNQYKVTVVFQDPNNRIKDGEEIFIRKGGSTDVLASGRLKNDSVELSGNVSKYEIGMLQSKNKELLKGLKILLENTNYSITFRGDSTDSGRRFLTNSSFYNIWRDFLYHLDDLELKKRQATMEFSRHVNVDKKKADSLLGVIENFDYLRDVSYKELGYKHPNNFATAYLLTGVPRLDKDFYLIYNNLSSELKESPWGKELKRQLDALETTDQPIKKNTLLGQALPEIIGNKDSGESFVLNAEAIKSTGAKITLIDFWASWCSPCRIENINLYPTYYNYKNKGFNVISFSLDENQDKWLQAIKTDKIPWVNFANFKGNNDQVTKDFNIKFLPSNVVVDEKGKVIGVNVFGDELKKMINDSVK